MNSDRRDFLKGVISAGVMPLLAGPGFSARAYAANSKVRLAAIGIGQQGWSDLHEFMSSSDLCEVVALCDTDLGSEATAWADRELPELPRYRDFRKLFDERSREFDAVLVATPDFSHFPATMRALKAGKHVFVEKPLAHSFRECELLLKAAQSAGVVTQMGNQGHSTIKYLQFKEYVQTGFVRDVERAVVHMNFPRRWFKWKGEVYGYPAAEPVPATLDWDSWLAAAQFHNYSTEYVAGEWRCWYDFGNGSLGDWGAHLMDCMHEFLLKGDLPTEVELLKVEGWNQFVFPCATTMAFTFPANDRHGDFRLEWYDGEDNLPPLPAGFVRDVPDGIPANSANSENDRVKLYPGKEMYQKDGTVWQSLSHKHPLHRVGDFDARLPDYPAETESHYRLFLRAIRGEVKGTTSPFEVAAPLSQLFCLGCIAQRLRRGFKFDPRSGHVVGDEVADGFLMGPPPRAGWEEYYRL